MSQYNAQTSGQSRFAPMGVWILACGAALALSACSTSTSFQTGTSTEAGQSSQTKAPTFASTASPGRFVSLYGTVDEEGGTEEGAGDIKKEGEDPLNKVIEEVYEEIESIVGDIGRNATDLLISKELYKNLEEIKTSSTTWRTRTTPRLN